MNVRVTVTDIRACNYCTKGCRAWFLSQGWDWSRFVTEGIPIEEFDGIDDAQVQMVVQAAKVREGIA